MFILVTIRFFLTTKTVMCKLEIKFGFICFFCIDILAIQNIKKRDAGNPQQSKYISSYYEYNIKLSSNFQVY